MGLADADLAVVFAVLLAASIFLYVVLDGFDLGVGLCLPFAGDADERDRMLGSIGPFWDANETWLVLGVGILLVAFPAAHGAVLTAVYLPVSLMLLGLVFRGVAFEMRLKVGSPEGRRRWEGVFVAGSLTAALAQGWILGRYVMGFAPGWGETVFAAVSALGVGSAYVLVGASWLVWRTEGALQRRAVVWARLGLVGAGVGLAAVSIATPLVSERIAARWFSWPEMVWLAPLPLATALLAGWLWGRLGVLPLPGDVGRRGPFWASVGLFALAFAGLSWSFYPWVVPDRLTLQAAAAAPESLRIILWGAALVLPVIALYTVLAWRIFRGKARPLVG
jgi:cytochrome d ubiquinol oxidase subunit II